MQTRRRDRRSLDARCKALGIRLAHRRLRDRLLVARATCERFPVDILKIDKSFVQRMGEKGFKPVIARAVAQLGKGLGLEVVAEGIERPAQAAALLRLGCGLGQGNAYAEPLSPDAVEVVLHRGRVDLPQDPAAGPKPILIRRRSRDIA